MTKQQKRNMSTKRRAPTRKFGAVTTINTAPVAIGNSIRGSAPSITQTPNGTRVVGRDFGFALASTASSVTGWELIGGMPLTPAVLASSGLRAFTQSYASFKINSVIVHYITSSPTSQAGDVLFYYERSRLSPAPDFSNVNFLPFVLSDPKTILGPQWTNHSALITPPADWKSTNYGVQDDIDEDCAGSVYMFSKTNATNSPGYVVIDYDITFKELSVNPRAGVLPISRGQFFQTALGVSALATTNQTTNYKDSTGWVIRGNSTANTTAQSITGLTGGDIYKCVASATASSINTFTNCSLSNILKYVEDTAAVTVDDGFTFYARWDAVNSTFCIAPTMVDAETNQRVFQSGVTATITFALPVTMHLVRTTGAPVQSSY
jgi:hypothetical protein